MLEAIQHADFRDALAVSTNAKYIEDQLLLQWHFYLRKKTRLFVSREFWVSLIIRTPFLAVRPNRAAPKTQSEIADRTGTCKRRRGSTGQRSTCKYLKCSQKSAVFVIQIKP
jgi:hypothetical protein